MRTIVLTLFLITPNLGAWESDWGSAFARAKEERKLVFVDFYAKWCVPCRMMDEKVFPQPAVADSLADFVLLKVDVDRSQHGRWMGIRTLPVYVIFDPWERERFRITGSHPAEPFARTLEMIGGHTRALVTIGNDLNAGETPDPFLRLGALYRRTGALVAARDAFDQAKKLAARAGDAAAAQRAEIDSATTWALEGKPRRALPILEKAATRPASAEADVLAWLGIARCRHMLNEATAAREAERRALAACTNDEMRKRTEEIIAGLARLSPSPR